MSIVAFVRFSLLVGVAVSFGDRPSSPPIAYRRIPSLEAAGYSIHYPMGSGGYGVVYSATQDWDGSSVAVKTLDRGEKGHQSFGEMSEMLRVWSGLKHSHVIPILDAMLDFDHYYQVVPKLGRTIFARFEHRGRLVSPISKRPREAQIVFLLYHVLVGLDYLHNVAGVVHGDLKPDNILFCNHSSSATPVLIDLDLMEQSAPDELLSRWAGTQLFMSPEIHAREPFRGRPADMWAVGVMAYIMAYGQYPFVNTGPLKQKMLPAYTSVQGWEPTPGLKAFIQSILRVNPLQRLTAAQALHHSSWLMQRRVALKDEVVFTKEEAQISGSPIESSTDDNSFPSGAFSVSVSACTVFLGLATLSMLL